VSDEALIDEASRLPQVLVDEMRRLFMDAMLGAGTGRPIGILNGSWADGSNVYIVRGPRRRRIGRMHSAYRARRGRQW
jgi:hypothetical protein